jgi:hypothetical protein
VGGHVAPGENGKGVASGSRHWVGWWMTLNLGEMKLYFSD